MFERFTDRARHVVVLAQEEARALKHDYIGTEHILLGLLGEEEGVAARVQESLGVTLEGARDTLMRITPPGDEAVAGPSIPFTPRGKKILELALREALSLGHNYIGTEHILLGLVRENEGVAARILLEFGADAEKVRNEVIRMLSGPGGRRFTVEGMGSSKLELKGMGLTDALLDGAGPPLRALAREIDGQLGRSPDAGDLLVLLACVPDGVASRMLGSLGIDAEKLTRAAEEARRAEARSRLLPSSALVAERESMQAEKEAAIEACEFERAADLRDRERKALKRELDESERAQDALLEELRRRLGLAADE